MAAQPPATYTEPDLSNYYSSGSSGSSGGGLASMGASIAGWLANLAPAQQAYGAANPNPNQLSNNVMSAAGLTAPSGGFGGGSGLEGLFGLGAAAGPLGALASTVGSFALGASQKKKAKKDARKQEKKRNEIIQVLQQQQAAKGHQSQQALLDGIKALQQGTAGALNEVGRTGRGAKTRVLDREQQNLGAITQGLTDRGLGSTTRSASLSRGVRSDSDRALLDIDDALTRIRSGIIERGSQGEAQMQGQLAQLFQRQAGQSTTQAQGFTNAIQPDVQSFDAGSIGALGPLLSVLLGGQEGSTSYQNLFASPNAASGSNGGR